MDSLSHHNNLLISHSFSLSTHPEVSLSPTFYKDIGSKQSVYYIPQYFFLKIENTETHLQK